MAMIKNYYAGANSSAGFYSLYDQALQGLETIYILKGGPGTGKSTFMRKIGLTLMERGLNLEYFHCSSDNQSLDGVVVPELKLGIVDGTAPHIVEPKYPGVVEQVIDLGEYRNDSYLTQYREQIIKLTDEISQHFQLAYDTFAEAKKIHLKKEDIYKGAMSFSKADEVTDDLLNRIFKDVASQNRKSHVRNLFFGAATPKGVVNFIDNITSDIDKRFIIKGRPGSGKSTLMKRIGKEAQDLGLDVQYYLCGFDPKSVDMVLIPSLSVCIVDGTAPHVVDPFIENDEVVDMFALCIDPEVEKDKRKEELDKLDVSYKTLMVKATNYISEAKRLHDNLEEYYVAAMDFKKVDAKREEILQQVLEKHQYAK